MTTASPMVGRIQHVLQAALEKKRQIDKQLAAHEAHIHAYEGSYLEESTLTGGNIVKGYHGRPRASTKDSDGAFGREVGHEVQDADRLFSGSSLTCQQALDQRAAIERSR
ncbi:Uncharacterized conserved protein [Phaffia rhodozyma]|uniref:Chromatin modification-related protein EAF6 n=1 Tax=Phaffia rhodozyma TaxID=264483 RepID=A0A0F7SF65_PHARH|nr:Uncharacterized conserved protein [Phaffia rhodozyma]